MDFPAQRIQLSGRYSEISYEPLSEAERQKFTFSEPEGAEPKSPYRSGFFPRLLGYSADQIRNYILNHGSVPNDSLQEENLNAFQFQEISYSSFSILIARYTEGASASEIQNEYLPVAIYILQNHQSVGYCLMDRLVIQSSFPEQVEISAGRLNSALTSNINGQISRLRQARGLSPQASYEIKVMDVSLETSPYAENYGLVFERTSSSTLPDLPSSITIDSFYPRTFSPQIESVIVDFLSKLANNPYEN